MKKESSTFFWCGVVPVVWSDKKVDAWSVWAEDVLLFPPEPGCPIHQQQCSKQEAVNITQWRPRTMTSFFLPSSSLHWPPTIPWDLISVSQNSGGEGCSFLCLLILFRPLASAPPHPSLCSPLRLLPNLCPSLLSLPPSRTLSLSLALSTPSPTPFYSQALPSWLLLWYWSPVWVGLWWIADCWVGDHLHHKRVRPPWLVHSRVSRKASPAPVKLRQKWWR